jgi:hypothetical protein
VGVGDDQLDPAQTTGFEAAQERGPERTILGVADGEPQHLAPAVSADSGGHDHGLGDDPPIDSGLAIGRVEEHVGERGRGQTAVAERADLDVEVGADPGDLGLGNAGVGAERLDQVVDLPGGHAVQVGLHHHREQRLIHPPAPLQQGREERAGPQLRDPQLQVAGGRGQGP